jgi:teichuronic acid biosynthesis glycosyltransferase TuaC
VVGFRRCPNATVLPMGKQRQRLRVLVLSRSYPTPVTPQLGLWVEAPTAHAACHVDIQVIAPVPWCPPLPALGALADVVKFRRVPAHQLRHGVVVHHPRYPAGPGYRLHAQEAGLLGAALARPVRRLRRDFPFDLIHAHFTYPEGVVCDQLARRYQVPLVVTEHAPWRPWFEQYPSVAAQAVPVARRVARHLAVSRFVSEDIVSYTRDPSRVQVLQIGMNEDQFRLAPEGERDRNRILFVGLPRPTKGVDVLLDAMAIVASRHPAARLTVVGDAIFRGARQHMASLRERAARPDLAGRVDFTGLLPEAEVARLMARSAMLVLPSRVETFGAVLIEALACGTPVVTTCSGGPQEVVTPAVGRVVPVNDAPALAEAMLDVLRRPEAFPAQRLRTFAITRYSWSRISDRLVQVYEEVARG